jgi:hypothetical protein
VRVETGAEVALALAGEAAGQALEAPDLQARSRRRSSRRARIHGNMTSFTMPVTRPPRPVLQGGVAQSHSSCGNLRLTSKSSHLARRFKRGARRAPARRLLRISSNFRHPGKRVLQKCAPREPHEARAGRGRCKVRQ